LVVFWGFGGEIKKKEKVGWTVQLKQRGVERARESVKEKEKKKKELGVYCKGRTNDVLERVCAKNREGEREDKGRIVK
jgi:hypothetical protein